ncbi:septal ring lytic transglycosylase RlpA family protein [Larsenimonas suaedae]|uniref:Endolytic peptidoglycan transglycosylase RlpA n=1 Tax=Larsenimonas suaedae TaxID=1851019 RepID=A0ABU1GRV4_9GAMM|nr:septal ring lytic transglycosylase RlpA family protein [Larsenimonas suaedae]MCM2972446.1 septal ring lytic transglycosylase RlpA family protein [Larsenimonas suaedae]MDR5894758.1 septal ring lytic transglycosylase RlpA family protein [Larsenimonas suaedae]
MIQHARNLAMGAGLLLSLAGCAGHQALDGAGSVERGEASYYAERYNGRTTASGERLDTGALTAAHRRLPFGTRVEVTNLDTDQSVEVRINDRGPFTRGRIIDLTPAAARRIGLTESGVAPVAVQVTQRP